MTVQSKAAIKQKPAKSCHVKRSTRLRKQPEDDDTNLVQALYHKLVLDWKVDDACQNLVAKRSFERSLAKINQAEKDEVPELSKVNAVAYLRALVKRSHQGAGHHYLTPLEDENLVAWVIYHNAINHPPCEDQVRDAARCFRMSARGEEACNLPSRSWLGRFLDDHSDVFSKRTVRMKSAKRLDAEVPSRVREWCDELKALIEKLNITEATRGQILACDETGFADDPQRAKRVKFIVTKNHEPEREAERSLLQHTSVLHICDASGVTIPPVTMFKGARIDIHSMPNAPPGSCFQFQSKGYFESDHLIEVLRHIVRNHIHPKACNKFKVAVDHQSKVDPTTGEIHLTTLRSTVFHRVLIMDCAPSHMSKAAMDYAEEHWIHLFFLPPNLTHIMQVSDLAVFAPVKNGWYRLEHTQTLINRSLRFNPRTFWLFLRPIWDKATSIKNVIRGFRLGGQWPIDFTPVIQQMQERFAQYDDKPVDPLFNTSLALRTMSERANNQNKTIKASRRENDKLKAKVEKLQQKLSEAGINASQSDPDVSSNVADSPTPDSQSTDSPVNDGWFGSLGAAAVHRDETSAFPSTLSSLVPTESTDPKRYLSQNQLMYPKAFVTPAQAQSLHLHQSSRSKIIAPSVVRVHELQALQPLTQELLEGNDALLALQPGEIASLLENASHLPALAGQQAPKPNVE